MKPLSDNSVLLTEEKKATKKTKKNSNKVRFQLENEVNPVEEENLYGFENDSIRVIENEVLRENEDVLKVPSDDGSVNGVSDDYVESKAINTIPTQNIFKVYLENNMIKSFKYDANTNVKDVLTCLKEKLKIKYIDYFGLCIKLDRNLSSVSSRHMLLFDETRLLLDVVHDYESCDFYLRFLFVPVNLEILLYKDINAFHYLYDQVNFLLKVLLDLGLVFRLISAAKLYNL